jgi:hypothetical protein
MRLAPQSRLGETLEGCRDTLIAYYCKRARIWHLSAAELVITPGSV